MHRTTRVFALFVPLFVALGVSRAWAGPFDAPYTGNVTIEMVAMSLTGNNGSLGTWNANRISSTPGTLFIDATRTITSATFAEQYRITASTPLGAVNSTINRNFELVGLLDALGGPYNPAIYPLEPVDSIPSSDPPGTTSGDSNFRTTNGSVSLGTGVTLNAEKLVLTDMASRTLIPGGERFVFNALLNLAANHSVPGNFIVGMSGQVTFDATPEPGALSLLLLATPLLRRRRLSV